MTSPTELVFRDDAYARSCMARVVEITSEGGVILDRTVFYPQGGGQPGDAGHLRFPGREGTRVVDTRWTPDRQRVIHAMAPGSDPLGQGDEITAELDWEIRHARMRVHTALHLLSVVLPVPVTGGSIGEGEGRLDFDLPEGGQDKAELTGRLRELVARNAAVTASWITDAELDANPGLVKTMSVQPPRGSGRVRLIAIDGIDLQPCGGTHVAHTGEIGAVTVTDIEKKGRQNRRIRIRLG